MRHSFIFFLIIISFGFLNAEVTENVYVTGSVIKKSSLLIANPISSFDQEDIKSRGTFHIENFLSHLPQINPST